MPASRLAFLTLVLGLALGAGIGFVLGGDSRPVAHAGESSVVRAGAGVDRSGARRDRSGSADSLATVQRGAAPKLTSGSSDSALTAAAADASSSAMARVEATVDDGGGDGEGWTHSITGAAFDQDGSPLGGVTVVASNGDNPYAYRAKGTDTSKVGRAWTGPRDVDQDLENSAKSLLKNRRVQRTATTGPDGRFELTGLRSGQHSLSAYYEGLVFDGQTVHVGESARFVGSPVNVYQLDLRLPDGGAPDEALILVGEDNRPDPYRWTSEDPVLRMSQPSASIKALAGNVQAPEWRTYVSDFASEIQSIDLDRDGEGPHVIELEPRSLLRVTLNDTSGLEPRLKPWVKVVEASKTEGGDMDDAFDDAQDLKRGWGDAFAIADLAAGSYVVGAGRGGGAPETTASIEMSGGVVEHELALGEVDMNRYVIVRCSGPTGQKLTKVEFRRRVEHEGGSTSGSTRSVARGPGEYWLPVDRLTNGKDWNDITSIELTATAKGYGELITPISRGQDVVELTFQPSAELMVRVDGDLTAGFTVAAVSIMKEENGNTRRLRSSREAKRVDADGVVRITGLQPGLFRVELKKAQDRNRGWGGNAIASQEVTVRPGTQEVSFLAPTFHEVTVYAPDMPKGTHFWLQLESADGNSYYGNNGAQLDEEHRATFKDVASGNYVLQCWGATQGRMEITVPTGEVLFEPKVINAYRVKKVESGKLGAKGGLQVGDEVVAVNDKEIRGDKFYQRLFLDLESEAVKLTLYRGGAAMDVSIGPAENPQNVWGEIGVEWEPISR